MEGSCSTGQSPQWAVVRVEEEDGEMRCIGLCSCTHLCVVRGKFPLRLPPCCNTSNVNPLAESAVRSGTRADEDWNSWPRTYC
jgi:hypothetical protein